MNRFFFIQKTKILPISQPAPNSNLNHVKEVSDWILNAKLPLSLLALKKKLMELKNLAAGLPDSPDILNQAGPQLDTARRLLEEAKTTR